MERSREALVGLVVLLAVFAGVAGSIWLGGGWGTDGRQMRAGFTEIGQLAPGASVKFRGVAVGTVDAVAVGPGGDVVLVDMTVQSELAVPADAAVVLAPESMFGGWQAEIVDRGDFPRYAYHEHGENGVLPGAALPDISRLTATADEIAGNLRTISERVQIAFTEETARNLRRAIDNIVEVSEGLSRVVDQQATRFDELSDGVTESARELGAAARAARLSFERVDGIIAEAGLETVLGDAGATVRNLRSATGQLDASLADVRSMARQADSTFARFNRLMAEAETGEGSLGRLLSDPALAMSVEDAVLDLRALLSDIRENPTRYLRFSIF